MRLDIGYAVRMGVSVQESLLDDCEEPALGALGGSVRRTPLAHGAWVDLRRGWLAGSGAVFARLAETVPWRAEKRHMYDKVVAVPRLLCFYGEDAPLPEPVRTAGLCLYRDGRDSVAWHGDTIGRGRTEDTMVAILSLGTPRPLLLRPRSVKRAGEVGGASLRFEVGHGDLLVMGGTCQRTWEHAVPKTSQPVG